jgi:NAD(P)-dependent dehydrogenase (short-subunit alcohol dehydrogenase family)
VRSIFITGSTQGIGLETAESLVTAGHRVVVHARDADKSERVRAALPGVSAVVTGDLGSLAQTRALAEAATAAGPFDVVIHNAGLGGGAATRAVTEDGLQEIFQVNVVAPYLLTALMPRPARLVYLTSGLEAQGRLDWEDPQYEHRAWNGMQAYSDSKLHDVLLAFAVARRWPQTVVNAVDPGWIKTRMGGHGATDELPQGAETQLWLATSDEPAATRSGRYLKRRQELKANPASYDHAQQDRLMSLLEGLTHAPFPKA